MTVMLVDMRHAYEHRAESRARGQRAAVRVRSALFWKHTAQAIVEWLGRIDCVTRMT
jgi:hypothetical protein